MPTVCAGGSVSISIASTCRSSKSEVDPMIRDEKILISGVSGIVAQPLARFLAQSNEVWGIARFTDGGREIEQYNPATGGSPIDRDLSPRESLEAAGITTRAIDLGADDFSSLP